MTTNICTRTESFLYQFHCRARDNNTMFYQENTTEIDDAIFNYEVFGGDSDE